MLCYTIESLFNKYQNGELSPAEKKLTLLATDLLTVIIKGNIENASEWLFS